MIDQNSTVARINGLAVLIYNYSADFCQVRYIGPEGKQITKHQFRVDTEKLRKFWEQAWHTHESPLNQKEKKMFENPEAYAPFGAVDTFIAIVLIGTVLIGLAIEYTTNRKWHNVRNN